MTEPIITSLLDTDLYKLTMMQCVFHHCPNTEVNYRFISRKPIDLLPYVSALKTQISAFCALQFTPEELDYLSTLAYFKPDFIDFLKTFRLDEKYITIHSDKAFELRIAGPWLHTILFEVPLLAIISETFYHQRYISTNLNYGYEQLQQKIAYLTEHSTQLQFSDFGTRRRFSKHWHEKIIAYLKDYIPEQFEGTSNIHFAKTYGLKPIGTMAHEYLQAFQVLAPHIIGSQAYALQVWLKEYPDMLGIALTDVLKMDIFLKEFDKTLAERYTGLRHDSGDPILWGEKALHYYRQLGIDPTTKHFVFSDSLTFPLMVKIYEHFKNQCRMHFGIGTNLTNDVGYSPLDIVIKMTHVNQQPVIKISDSKGKIVCENNAYLDKIKNLFQLQDE